MNDNPESDFFSFDDDTHTYRNGSGALRPSVTQTLKEGGIFNYSRIDPAVLERKRIIGTNVHAWTARFDTQGVDARDANAVEDMLLELSEDEAAYARGWAKLRRELAFDILEVEKKMVRPLAGLEMGGTPDRKIRIGNRIYILDIKCVASFHPGWRLQLADYVMLDTGRSDCSAYGRCIVRLLTNGTYRYDPIDPKWDASDSAVATAFLQTFVWRRNHKLV